MLRLTNKVIKAVSRMDYLQRILIDFELHSVDGIKECFENGVDPNDSLNGKPLIYSLVEMYTRGPLFKKCVKVFVDYGLELEPVLLTVFLDDAETLDELIKDNSALLQNKYSFNCAFTPLIEASLLHICAEFNHLNCAKILVDNGTDINVKAGLDKNGFGGQTPIFHTVNQHENKSMDVLKFLVSKNADLSLTIKGLIWGKGYDWETFIPSVNPISYSMMGLLRQFQRTEKQIYEVVSLLMQAHYGVDYFPPNIPNKYLSS